MTDGRRRQELDGGDYPFLRMLAGTQFSSDQLDQPPPYRLPPGRPGPIPVGGNDAALAIHSVDYVFVANGETRLEEHAGVIQIDLRTGDLDVAFGPGQPSGDDDQVYVRVRRWVGRESDAPPSDADFTWETHMNDDIPASVSLRYGDRIEICGVAHSLSNTSGGEVLFGAMRYGFDLVPLGCLGPCRPCYTYPP